MFLAFALVYLTTASQAADLQKATPGWTLLIREALPPEAWGQNVWLGLRNDTSQPTAACVGQVSSTAEASQLGDGPGTHACTNTSAFHLVMPGEAFYFMGSAPLARVGETLRFSVSISEWPLGGSLPEGGRITATVMGAWPKP